jgi:hypothetical protein
VDVDVVMDIGLGDKGVSVNSVVAAVLGYGSFTPPDSSAVILTYPS